MDVPQPARRRSRRRLLTGAAIAGALVALTLGSRAIPPALPNVDRSSVWIGEVRRGPLVREVAGPGTLVPKDVRWLTARSSAQVKEVLAKPGAVVESDTIVARLSSSQLELAALEAAQEVSQAEARLAHLEATLNAEHLAQQSSIATLTSELAEAERQAQADAELARRGFLSELEQGRTVGTERELRERLEFERKRLSALSRGIRAQLASHRAEIVQLRSIAGFRQGEVDALTLRAGVAGVLSELSLELGQWVAAGASLGKVVRPDRLVAVLRIPETQTRDLQLDQVATVEIQGARVLGRVARIDPAAQAGNVAVDVALSGALPPGARPDLNVRGTIELERLDSVVFVDRPQNGAPGTRVSLFKVASDGQIAERTQVLLGRSSVQCVEIVSGLSEGDRVILSELSDWDEADRIRLR